MKKREVGEAQISLIASYFFRLRNSKATMATIAANPTIAAAYRIAGDIPPDVPVGFGVGVGVPEVGEGVGVTVDEGVGVGVEEVGVGVGVGVGEVEGVGVG